MDKIIALHKIWYDTVNKETEFSKELDQSIGEKMRKFISMFEEMFETFYPYNSNGSMNSIAFKRLFQDAFKIDSRFRGSGDMIGETKCVTLIDAIFRQIRIEHHRLSRNGVNGLQSSYTQNLIENLSEILESSIQKDGQKTIMDQTPNEKPVERVIHFKYESFVQDLDAAYGKAALTGKRMAGLRKETETDQNPNPNPKPRYQRKQEKTTSTNENEETTDAPTANEEPKESKPHNNSEWKTKGKKKRQNKQMASE